MQKKEITEYTKAIRMMLKLKGINATDAANHLALEKKLITLDQFQAGARIIAKAFLNA